MKSPFLLVIVAFISVACRNVDRDVTSGSGTQLHEVKILEIIRAKDYNFLFVKENNTEYWLAAPKTDIKTGETYYYDKGFRVSGYKSTELNRDFESVTFVEKLDNHHSKDTADYLSPGASKRNLVKTDINLPPAEGGISISKLFAFKEKFKGKSVIIRGQVTKFSPDIMGKNWIHIQDGSEYNGKFDLTVTSDSEVRSGDTITFRGRITLDRDLGYGYFYEILMEDAVILH